MSDELCVPPKNVMMFGPTELRPSRSVKETFDRRLRDLSFYCEHGYRCDIRLQHLRWTTQPFVINRYQSLLSPDSVVSYAETICLTNR